MDYSLVSDYYFLNASLPPIRLGEPLEMSFQEFAKLMNINLNRPDLNRVDVIRRFYDIQNTRYLWMGQPLDPYGSLNPSELEDSLVTGIGIPDYLYAFLEKYEEKEERLEHFSQVMSQYFEKEIPRAQGILRKMLEFERSLRLVFTALRAKRINRDFLKEFQYEDPDDDLVAQIIAQKDSATYEPPSRYENMKGLFENYADSPTELYQALAEFRFSGVEELLGVDMFSVERTLGYMVQLIIAEKWLKLDKQKGKEILESIVREKS